MGRLWVVRSPLQIVLGSGRHRVMSVADRMTDPKDGSTSRGSGFYVLNVLERRVMIQTDQEFIELYVRRKD